MFTRDGVTYACICNNDEMIQEKFHQKLKNALCQLEQSEPYNPRPNRTEREAKELKKATGQNLIESKASKKLVKLERQYCHVPESNWSGPSPTNNILLSTFTS